jgi:phage-related minor tail protein
MAEITLDTLLVRIAADTRPLNDALAGISGAADSSFSGIEDAARTASDGMARALSGFVRGGKLGFEDLRSSALSSLGAITDSAIRSGLGSLFGASAKNYLGTAGGNVVGGILSGLFGHRAAGGPVAPDTPYVVGEYGRELFVPRSSGAIVPAGAASSGRGRAISITVNVQGGAGRADMRQSAGQVASAVARTLARADRNL